MCQNVNSWVVLCSSVVIYNRSYMQVNIHKQWNVSTASGRPPIIQCCRKVRASYCMSHAYRIARHHYLWRLARGVCIPEMMALGLWHSKVTILKTTYYELQETRKSFRLENIPSCLKNSIFNTFLVNARQQTPNSIICLRAMLDIRINVRYL